MASQSPDIARRETSRPSPMLETYVAARFWVDNWRWQGVPFYVRTGKRLARKKTEVAIQFKSDPRILWSERSIPIGSECPGNAHRA